MAPDLKSELVMIVKNGEKNILIDLSVCNFCDSSGMSALSLGNRLCKEANGKFVLCECSTGLRNRLDLAGFGNLITITSGREQAEALFH